jgi:hypothetical protein
MNPTAELDPETPDRPRLGLVGYLLIAAVAISPTALVAATNLIGIGHPERLMAISAVLFVAGMGIAHLAMRLGLLPMASVLVASVAVLLLSRGGAITGRLGPLLGVMFLIVFLAGLAWLLRRIGNEGLFKGAAIVLAVFFLAAPVGQAVINYFNLGTSVANHPDDVPQTLASTPDIVVVLVDGYSGIISYQANIGEPQWPGKLSAAGFQIPESAWSSYPTTVASVPSLLDMSYVLEAGPGINRATTADLHRIISGENATVRLAGSNGYHVTFIESGWSGSSCGPGVDSCVPSPFLDEGTFMGLAASMVGPLIAESYGSPMTMGTQQTMNWLRAELPALAGNGRPDFVFAHVMAPHAPFFLNERCETDYRVEYTSFGRGVEDAGPGIEGYRRQVECIDSLFDDLASTVPDQVNLILVADHGTDIRNQLNTLPADWDNDAIEERFNPLLAVRSAECNIGDEVVLPNLMRRLFSCLGADLPDLPPRMFLYPAGTVGGQPVDVAEVPSETVSQFLEMRTS